MGPLGASLRGVHRLAVSPHGRFAAARSADRGLAPAGRPGVLESTALHPEPPDSVLDGIRRGPRARRSRRGGAGAEARRLGIRRPALVRVFTIAEAARAPELAGRSRAAARP